MPEACTARVRRYAIIVSQTSTGYKAEIPAWHMAVHSAEESAVIEAAEAAAQDYVAEMIALDKEAFVPPSDTNPKQTTYAEVRFGNWDRKTTA